jgi:hypothetical protein
MSRFGVQRITESNPHISIFIASLNDRIAHQGQSSGMVPMFMQCCLMGLKWTAM